MLQKQKERDSLTSHHIFKESEIGKTLSKFPLGFLDIGARGGVHDVIEPIASLTSVFGFEPDQSECERINQLHSIESPYANFKLFDIALYDNNCDVTLNLMNCDTNHSLLKPNSDFVDRYNMHSKWSVIGQHRLKASRLDDVWLEYQRKETKPSAADFIKIDTQGTEFEILDGATELLKKDTIAIICEVSFSEIYHNQKLFSDVEKLLRGFGFTFYGFSNGPHSRSRKLLDKQKSKFNERMIYADAVFFKDPLKGTFFQHCGNKELSTEQLHKLFVVACLLDYYDFALELAQETWLKLAGNAQADALKQLIFDISNFPVSHTIAAVRELNQKLKESPDNANVLVGGFVDERRKNCNYDDVLNVSPLPNVGAMIEPT